MMKRFKARCDKIELKFQESAGAFYAKGNLKLSFYDAFEASMELAEIIKLIK